MALIVGIEKCKVDANGRFKFPSALKKQLLPIEDNRFVVRGSIYNPCLELWPYDRFQEEVALLQSKLNLYDANQKRLYRKLTEANLTELDNSDRLLIPMEQKLLAKLDKDIVLISAGKYIELWDAKTYNELDNDQFDYQAAAFTFLTDNNTTETK